MRREEEGEEGEERENSVSKGAYEDKGPLSGEREGEHEMPKERERALEPLGGESDSTHPQTPCAGGCPPR